MKHIIIGTAGHIDHGKTTLIKALTGIDTDRLAEEKKRGISIDLGFTHFNLSGNETAGIIDVPGHEKFLKNMLAGISGMDMILLVIAADEGIMPQTMEHLEILDLIGMEKGIVVITKSDKVDNEWLELLEEDIRAHLSNTFLENAPFVFTDSITGKGIEKLKETIVQVYSQVHERNLTAIPRLFIDRVFTIKGFGNVVTGTLIEGILNLEDEVMIYPDKISAKIRGLQVHDSNVRSALAGQRVAINLSGIDKEKLNRGDVLTYPSSLIPSMIIDVKIRAISKISKDIEHWDRIRLYHGAREILGRIVPLDGAILEKGSTGYAQIRLEESLAAKAFDKIIIRFYSPMETVAGGIIIDPLASKHSNADDELLQLLSLKAEGNMTDIVGNFILESKFFLNINDIALGLQTQESVVVGAIENLLEFNKIDKIGRLVIHKDYLELLRRKSISALDKYHTLFPLKSGMDKEEFRSRLGIKLKTKDYDAFLQLMSEKQWITLFNNHISAKNFKVILSSQQAIELEQLINCVRTGKYAPNSIKELITNQSLNALLDYAINQNLLLQIGDDYVYLPELIQEMQEYILSTISKQGSITVGQLRDKYSISRKYAVNILEYFDRIRLTKRVEDFRVLFHS